MAVMKYSIFSPHATLLLVLIVLVVQPQMNEAQAQSCSASLGNVNVCAPFVLPGAPNTNPNPSPDCCGALQSVQHDCLCSTLRIASRLPAQCNLPPLSCVAN